MSKIVEIDKTKRISKKAINTIIKELEEIRDSDPNALDSMFIAYGIDKKTNDSKYKGRVAYKSYLFGIDFGITGFASSILHESNASMLYDGAVDQLPEEFLLDSEKDDSDDE